MKKILLLIIFAISISGYSAQLPTGFVEQLIAQNLDPTDLVLTPDGRIFITFKSGKIMIVEDGTLRATPLINLESIVDNYNERGMGHVVLDPAFDTNGYYYVYYTVKGENHNRVSRFTAVGNFSDPASELVLLNLDVMAGTIHNAGDMEWGIDGKLYISAGDGANGNAAQSMTSLLGKVMRINADGTIPTDNPYYTTTTGNYRAIWALGFRNPYSMDIQPGTGKMFICDVGGGNWEEINHVMAGSNYGWPGIEGKRTTEALPPIGTYRDPFYTYAHGGAINQGCSIVGAAFYNPTVNQFPTSYTGRFFFADYCNGYIKSVDPANVTDIEIFATGINRPLAIVIAADGTLYYLARAGIGGGSDDDNTSTQNGTLWKVSYTGSGAPFISVNPQSKTVAVGEDATFTVQALGTQPLTYQWQMDGVNIPSATLSTYTFVNAQLANSGKAFSCVVSNASGTATSTSATLTVTANTRPTPVFTFALPGNATTYKGGQTLSLTGSATDAEDGTLPATSLSWKIDFHHGAHTHPALASTAGQNTLTYVIPKVGETSENVWYRVYLTATDVGNPALSKTVFQDILPQKTIVHLTTNPPNLRVMLDGQPIQTPYTFSSVTNTTRTLEAPLMQTVTNKLYSFEQWSETGVDRIFSFDTPDAEKTYTAQFTTVPLGNGAGLKGSYYSNQDKTFIGSPTLVRVDAVVDFNWGDGSPDALVSVDKFTARWEGEIKPIFSGLHTFYLKGDDGVRLWVNNVQLINGWMDQGPTTYAGEIMLDTSQKYPIRIEYYENAGGATVELTWKSTYFEKQTVPGSQLYNDLITNTELTESNSLVLYPTIVDDMLHIRDERSRKGSWVIINQLGQKLQTGTMEKTLTLNVNDLPGGVYLFKTDKQVIRFVKK